MLLPRIIPCLLIRNKGLVKTVKFKNPKYVGDPINAVKIFNEKEVDELIVLDIDASVKKMEPDYSVIENLAAECRMPLCYGGGVTTADQVQKIIQLGVEKVSLSSVVINDPYIVSRSAERVGNQSVVVVLDVKKSFTGTYEVWINNGTKNTHKEVTAFAKKVQDMGAGELVINSIDNDGLMQGYDTRLISKVRESISIPLTVLGGAGSVNHLRSVIDEFGTIGVAAGSLFVFKGIYKAVLINYPGREEKQSLYNS